MNSLVAKRLREQGIVDFLKNYHKPSLYKIKKSPQMYERFLQYDNKLKLNYKRLLKNIEDEKPDIILSDNRKGAEQINWRIGKHSPLWFCIIAFWETFSGDSYLSKIVMPANMIALLYLASLYIFLGLFFKQDEFRSKLLIIFTVLLLPAFLRQVPETTNDLILGTFVTWVLFFLLKNDNEKINNNDLLVGFFYSVAVLIKFTSLTLMLPITLYYLIEFKFKAIPKLFVAFLFFSVFPILLYTVFEYDMILNVITGSTEEYTLKAMKSGSIFNLGTFVWYILYDQYNFGIPFVILLITHISKVRQYLSCNEVLKSYMFISFFFMLCFFFWGSGVARHWIGFIPLTIPLLVYAYNNSEEKSKMLLSTSIFLLVNNLLILVHVGIIMASYYQSHFQVRYWSY
jgi:hypothetical protein